MLPSAAASSDRPPSCASSRSGILRQSSSDRPAGVFRALPAAAAPSTDPVTPRGSSARQPLLRPRGEPAGAGAGASPARPSPSRKVVAIRSSWQQRAPSAAPQGAASGAGEQQSPQAARPGDGAGVAAADAAGARDRSSQAPGAAEPEAPALESEGARWAARGGGVAEQLPQAWLGAAREAGMGLQGPPEAAARPRRQPIEISASPGLGSSEFLGAVGVRAAGDAAEPPGTPPADAAREAGPERWPAEPRASMERGGAEPPRASVPKASAAPLHVGWRVLPAGRSQLAGGNGDRPAAAAAAANTALRAQGGASSPRGSAPVSPASSLSSPASLAALSSPAGSVSSVEALLAWGGDEQRRAVHRPSHSPPPLQSPRSPAAGDAPDYADASQLERGTVAGLARSGLE